MPQFKVGCDLTYEVRQSTVFQFQIAVARTPHQKILNEQLQFNPNVDVAEYLVGNESNRLTRVVVEPCTLEVHYQATVDVTPTLEHSTDLDESEIADMPPNALTYLNPSRYCESDLLARFAFEEFGQLQRGFSRVNAICQWVNEHLDYVPGSTTSTTTSADVILQRVGVCRDYAHLAITLCRGVGIPARYAAGYAVDLQPPDFHGFMEAYLGGSWYLFDPTQLAPVNKLIRIGVGRDAADVSFATINGNCMLTNRNVWAEENGGSVQACTANATAVSTA